MLITKSYHNIVGEVKRNPDTGELFYYTERDNLKNQIYRQKTSFSDGISIYHIPEPIGISKSVCQTLLQQKVTTIYFLLKHYPTVHNYQLLKISLTNFLLNSIDHKEINYDSQKIISIRKLEKCIEWNYANNVS